MAEIVIVHGIGNQFRGESVLHAEWFPALCDGLNRAGHKPLPDPSTCFCPFYGDLFRVSGHLGAASVIDGDLKDASDDDAALIQAIWEHAAEVDKNVPRPADFKNLLGVAPKLLERAITALAKSAFLADALPLRFFGDLKQVAAYLNDAARHDEILDRVLAHIGPETKIVIGHSLGSVVAYEAVCRKPERVNTLLTLGSPLGIRNVVFDKLTPKPLFSGAGCWPEGIMHWTNIAAAGDIVAAQKQLKPLFGGTLEDIEIDSGWDAHASARYLNTREAGMAVARALVT